MRNGSDIRAFGGGDAELGKRFIIGAEAKVVDVNEPRLAFDLYSLAREFIERNAIFLDRRNHRRRLHLIADERLRGGVQFVQGQRRHRKRGDQFAIGIITVGGFAELHRAGVNLVVGH